MYNSNLVKNNNSPNFKGIFQVNSFQSCKGKNLEGYNKLIQDIFVKAGARPVLSAVSTDIATKKSSWEKGINPNSILIKALVPSNKDVEVLSELQKINAVIRYQKLTQDLLKRLNKKLNISWIK